MALNVLFSCFFSRYSLRPFQAILHRRFLSMKCHLRDLGCWVIEYMARDDSSIVPVRTRMVPALWGKDTASAIENVDALRSWVLDICAILPPSCGRGRRGESWEWC